MAHYCAPWFFGGEILKKVFNINGLTMLVRQNKYENPHFTGGKFAMVRHSAPQPPPPPKGVGGAWRAS